MNELTSLAEWNVPAEEIDSLGHMSTGQYARRALDGWTQVLTGIGAVPAALVASGLTAAAVDQHVLFRREQLVDAPLALAGGVLAAEGPHIDVYQEFTNTASGDIAAMFRTRIELQKLANRAPSRLPLPWLQAAQVKRIDAPPRSQPRTLTTDSLGASLTLADLQAAGIRSHLRREITPDLCDAEGFLIPPVPPKTVPKALPGAGGVGMKSNNQGVLDQVWGHLEGYVWPTLETRVLTLRTARAGDVLDSYAALLSVGHKVIHSAVWVFEARTGALTSVAHMVSVFFSYAARRTLDMPPEERQRLESFATPQLLAPGHKR